MSIKNIINDYISMIMDKNIDIKNPAKWNLIKEDIEAYGFPEETNIYIFNVIWEAICPEYEKGEQYEIIQ